MSRGASWVMVGAIGALALAMPHVAYPHKPITTTILFKKEIAQIFQRKCFQCHSDSNVAMSLTTYELARPWARAIREEIIERHMPPWGAVAGYGHFANDLSLTQREIDIILSWADGGAPSGVPKVEESIPPVFVAPTAAWDHGAPSATLKIAPQAVAANAPLRRVRVAVATGLSAPTGLRGIAFKPSDRRVVRSVALFDASSKQWLGAWTPWYTAFMFPDGVGPQLPAGAKIVADITYKGIDEDVTEAGEIGLYVAAQRPATSVGLLTLATPPTEVAPSTSGRRERATVTVAEDTIAYALWPELGDGTRAFEVTATRPDGTVTPIVWVKDNRADWRTPYVLKEPLTFTRGTRLTLTTYFDNDSDRAREEKAEVQIAVARKRRPVASAR